MAPKKKTDARKYGRISKIEEGQGEYKKKITIQGKRKKGEIKKRESPFHMQPIIRALEENKAYYDKSHSLKDVKYDKAYKDGLRKATPKKKGETRYGYNIGRGGDYFEFEIIYKDKDGNIVSKTLHI